MLSPRHFRPGGISPFLLSIAKPHYPISIPFRAFSSSSSSSSSSSANQTPDDNEYHTIGKHIFDGCTTAEALTLGEQLARVVEAGGPGRKALRQAEEAAGRKLNNEQEQVLVGRGSRRIRRLDRDDIFETVGIENAGIIKPTAIIRLADEAFREYIQQEAQHSGLDLKALQIRQHSIQIPSITDGPRAKGVIHYTVNGPRILPVDIYTSLSFSSSPAGNDDIISGELRLLSGGGKSEYCGSCRIEYTLYHVDKGKGETVPLSAREVLKI